MVRFSFESQSSVYLHTLPNVHNKEFQINQVSPQIFTIQRLLSSSSEKNHFISNSHQLIPPFNSHANSLSELTQYQGQGISQHQGLQKIQYYEVNKNCIDDSLDKMNIEGYHKLFEDIRQKSYSLALDLGLNSSIWLIGRHISNDFGDLLFKNIRSHHSPNFQDYFQTTLAELFSSLQSHVTQIKSIFRLKYCVKVKCFEIFGEQIRDLLKLNSEGDASNSNNSTSNNTPIIREHKSIPYVDSLLEIECESAEHAYSVLSAAYHRRLCLVVEHLLENTSHHTQQVSKMTFVGYVGNIILQIQTSQTLCTIANDIPLELIERNGTIQYNILADTDSLLHKAVPKLENLTVVPLNSIQSGTGLLIPGAIVDFIVPGGSIGSSGSVNVNANGGETLPNNSRFVTQQLLSSAKALSTLSRVISKLYQENESSNSTISHISYRDSILTRVLQPSLEGKFANSICLFLDIRRDRFNSDLTLTTAQSCVNFLRIMTELQGARKISLPLRPSERSIPVSHENLEQSMTQLTVSIKKLMENGLLESQNQNESDNENENVNWARKDIGDSDSDSHFPPEPSFWDLLNAFRNDNSVSSKISELLSLEEERNSLLGKLGGRYFDDEKFTSSKSVKEFHLIESEKEQEEVVANLELEENRKESESEGNSEINKEEKVHDDVEMPERLPSMNSFPPLREVKPQRITSKSNSQSFESYEDEVSHLPSPLGGRKSHEIDSKLRRSNSRESKDESNQRKKLTPNRPPPSPSPSSPSPSPNQFRKSTPLPPPIKLSPISKTHQSRAKLLTPPKSSPPNSKISREKFQSKNSVSSRSLFEELTEESPILSPLSSHSPPLMTIMVDELPVNQFLDSHNYTSTELEESPQEIHLETPQNRGLSPKVTKKILFPQVKQSKNYFKTSVVGHGGGDNHSGLTDLERQFLKAVGSGNLPVVKYCISQGVNLSVKNSFGRFSFPFHLNLSFSYFANRRDAVQISTRNGSLDILQELFEAGASLLTRGKRGDSLFHLAAANGHIFIMEWLTSVGVMHNLIDSSGQTCAHIAARRGEINVLKYLESAHQMDLNQKDFDDLTPLDHIPKSSLQGNEVELEETRVFLLSRRENTS